MAALLESTSLEVEETTGKDVTEYVKGRLLIALDSVTPELKQLSELEIIRKLDPTPVDYALRRSLWNAIDLAEKMGRDTISQVEVYKGVCTQQTFNESVLMNPLRVAFISRPVVDHAHFYEALNKLAVQKIMDYVRENPVNEKLLPAIIKIAEMSANRAYGAVAQKMQIQSKNLNVEVRQTEQNVPSPDQGQLTERVQELQAKLLDQAKDVTPKD